MRIIKVELSDILDLVNCADDYGFEDDILMDAFAKQSGFVTNEEIKEYADFYVSEDGVKQGYAEEDQDAAMDRLTRWRDKYCKKT